MKNRLSTNKRHSVVIDLGYGDSGKGTTVDWLTKVDGPETIVVRFNGGAQAAHNVVTDDGRHHTFAQFGSGTLNGSPTFLSKYVLVEPYGIIAEGEHLRQLGVPSPWHGLHIDRLAKVTTPYHALANRYREDRRGDKRHGSCGIGIGETVYYAKKNPDALCIQDLGFPSLIKTKLQDIADFYTDEFGSDWLVDVSDTTISEIVDDYHTVYRTMFHMVDSDWLRTWLRLNPNRDAVFEGAQGALIDEKHGFDPHTTWSNCTAENALALLFDIGVDEPQNAEIIGVLRSYMTRHGAGPFPSEFVKFGDVKMTYVEPHNGYGEYQGSWRTGWMDYPMLRYVSSFTRSIDSLAITHLDADFPSKAIGGYMFNGQVVAQASKSLDFSKVSISSFRDFKLADLETIFGAQIKLKSYGPSVKHKKVNVLDSFSRTTYTGGLGTWTTS